MRTWAITLLLAATCLCEHPAHAAPERVMLETPKSVEGLRLGDVDGDGLTDLLVIEGRTLRIHRGRKGALPPAAPTWTGRIADDVSFVDIAPTAGDGKAAVLTYGTRGVERVPVLAKGEAVAVPGADPLTWRDSKRVVFADLVRAHGLLLPKADGVVFRPAHGGAPIAVTLQPVHAVKAPGPFLEDSCEVQMALPSVVIGAAGTPAGTADAKRGVWTLDGSDLVAQSAGARVRWDLSFLAAAEDGKEVEQQLVDLDADGHPDLVHRIFTNRDSRYGFFRTQPPAAGPSARRTSRR